MKNFFLTIGLLISICANGQESRHRYVLWPTPTGKRNVTIDGLAIGLMAHPSFGGHLQIRGLNVELIPFAIFTLQGSMVTTILSPLVAEFYATPPDDVTTHIRGISISGGLFE